MDLLLAAYQKTKEEKTAEVSRITKLNFKVEKNKAFITATILLNDIFLEKNNTNSNNN